MLRIFNNKNMNGFREIGIFNESLLSYRKNLNRTRFGLFLVLQQCSMLIVRQEIKPFPHVHMCYFAALYMDYQYVHNYF